MLGESNQTAQEKLIQLNKYLYLYKQPGYLAGVSLNCLRRWIGVDKGTSAGTAEIHPLQPPSLLSTYLSIGFGPKTLKKKNSSIL